MKLFFSTWKSRFKPLIVWSFGAVDRTSIWFDGMAEKQIISFLIIVRNEINKSWQTMEKIRSHWQKQKQLIRTKYNVSYPMLYNFRSCSKFASIARVDTKWEKVVEKDTAMIFCGQCRNDLSKCQCLNGLGNWWKKINNEVERVDSTVSNLSTNKSSEKNQRFQENRRCPSIIDALDKNLFKFEQTKILAESKNRRETIAFFIEQLAKKPNINEKNFLLLL